MNKNIGLT